MNASSLIGKEDNVMHETLPRRVAKADARR